MTVRESGYVIKAGTAIPREAGFRKPDGTVWRGIVGLRCYFDTKEYI